MVSPIPFTQLRVSKKTSTMDFPFYTHNATLFVYLLCATLHLSRCISFSKYIMVEITSEYETRLARSDHVPRFSYRRRMLRDEGGPNRFFLMYLCCEQSITIPFLKDIGLLWSTVQCNTCGRDMTWSSDSSISEGFRLRCQRRVAGVSIHYESFLG